jgi:diguanylate cyclase (GGDEF)-like protein
MREVASALRGRCRPYDEPCRLGSDAFAVVLGQTEGRHAERACARILESVRRIELPTECAGAKVTCSGGLVSTSELPRGFNQTEVVKAASEALDQAKQAGRDRLQTASAPRL